MSVICYDKLTSEIQKAEEYTTKLREELKNRDEETRKKERRKEEENRREKS
jgi:hypothetical protein